MTSEPQGLTARIAALELDRQALHRHVSDHDRELAQATLTARDNAGKLSQLANGVYRDVQNMQSMAELLREIRKVIDMFDDRIAHLETRIGNLDNDLDGQSLNIVAVNVRLDEHHQMLWSLENTKENKHEQ
jgi:chromosome segregation ATPase